MDGMGETRLAAHASLTLIDESARDVLAQNWDAASHF
jgi:hypothetical protein